LDADIAPKRRVSAAIPIALSQLLRDNEMSGKKGKNSQRFEANS
jgi:hypothetical protein